jgi:hypothetical protein
MTLHRRSRRFLHVIIGEPGRAEWWSPQRVFGVADQNGDEIGIAAVGCGKQQVREPTV